MATCRESPNQTAELLFGLETARDWLAKASRERDRFLSADEVNEQTDHALNFTITTSHLEDWVYRLHIRGDQTEWGDYQTSGKFDQWVRDHSPAMRLLADVNNAAKHRVLDQRGSNAKAAKLGCVVYRIDYLPEFERFMTRISRFSEIVSVQEIRDDGRLVAYEMRTKAHIFSFEHGFRLFIDIANEAIRFWDEFLDERELETDTLQDN